LVFLASHNLVLFEAENSAVNFFQMTLVKLSVVTLEPI
jgi:hypothetical protein